MNDNQDFNQLYRDVSENIAAAMDDLSKLSVSNTEGQERLDSMKKTLREMQAGFDAELEFLEANAEWEKFTMAFIGETNAGKSTIIESLRILFNESSRRKLIEDNQNNVDELAQKLQAHASRAEKALADSFHKHARGVEAVRQDCGALQTILAEEAAERVRVEQKAASSRVKRNLIFGSVAGALVGASVASALFLTLGG